MPSKSFIPPDREERGRHASSKRPAAQGKAAARTLVSCLFSFLLSLLLLAGSALVVAKTGFTEENIQSVADIVFAGMVREEAQEAAVDYTLPTGIDSGVLDGLFDRQTTKEHLEGSIHAAYTGEDYKADTSELEQRLGANVKASFAGEGYSFDAETQAAVDAYCSDIAAIYQNRLKLPVVGVLVRVHQFIDRFFSVAVSGIAVLSALLELLLIRLYHLPHHALRYWCYATGATAIEAFAAPYALYVSGVYRQLNVTPQSFHRFLVNLCESVLKRCFFAAGLWLAVTLVLFGAVALMRMRLQKKHSTHHVHHHHAA